MGKNVIGKMVSDKTTEKAKKRDIYWRFNSPYMFLAGHKYWALKILRYMWTLKNTYHFIQDYYVPDHPNIPTYSRMLSLIQNPTCFKMYT